MNEIYGQFADDVEVYSIDESFLDLSRYGPADRRALALDLRSTVRKWTGVPTCVGIGPTKTLAKVANAIAKKDPKLAGVCDLSDPAERALRLDRFDVADVWGVGPASTAKLAAIGVWTAGDLTRLDPKLARKPLTVVGERIVHELRGMACIELETVTPQRKGIAVTRSFSRSVTTLDALLEAVLSYAFRAGEKLRRHGLAASHLTVFAHSNLFNSDPPFSASTTEGLIEASSDGLVLIAAATRGAAALAAGRETRQGRRDPRRPGAGRGRTCGADRRPRPGEGRAHDGGNRRSEREAWSGRRDVGGRRDQARVADQV